MSGKRTRSETPQESDDDPGFAEQGYDEFASRDTADEEQETLDLSTLSLKVRPAALLTARTQEHHEQCPAWVFQGPLCKNAPLVEYVNVYLEEFSPSYKEAQDFLVLISEPRSRCAPFRMSSLRVRARTLSSTCPSPFVGAP